jgi:hypothetical protein
LLIALAVLGLIASLTIPAVVKNIEETTRKAVFKETLSAIGDILYEGYQDGSLRRVALKDRALTEKLRQKLNYTKFCPTNAMTEGCLDPVDNPSGDNPWGPGFVLPNGAVIFGYHQDSSRSIGNFAIDWNGAKPPNLLYLDTIVFTTCYEKDATVSGQTCRHGGVIQEGWGSNQDTFFKLYR